MEAKWPDYYLREVKAAVASSLVQNRCWEDPNLVNADYIIAFVLGGAWAESDLINKIIESLKGIVDYVRFQMVCIFQPSCTGGGARENHSCRHRKDREFRGGHPTRMMHAIGIASLRSLSCMRHCRIEKLPNNGEPSAEGDTFDC